MPNTCIAEVLKNWFDDIIDDIYDEDLYDGIKAWWKNQCEPVPDILNGFLEGDYELMDNS